MKVLAPIDGSDCSFRALEFATEFVERYEGTLDVVHFTDHAGESTDRILERANEILEAAELDCEPAVTTDLRMEDVRYANRVGKDILERVEEEGYDHVVMGHHGSGTVEKLIVGSATRTVIEADTVPVTVIP